MVEFPTLDSCAAISEVRVTDARTDKTIGKRFVENKSSASCEAAPRRGLRRAGASVGKPGAPTLRLTVDQINTTENVLHRSGYEGRIVMSAELTTSCWKDRLDGFAENYGYAGSVENYQKTLNHALDRAMIRMMSSWEFKRAACSCGG